MLDEKPHRRRSIRLYDADAVFLAISFRTFPYNLKVRAGKRVNIPFHRVEFTNATGLY